MFKNILFFALMAFVLGLVPFAYAGKVELTTYYPAPYGDYKDLNSTGNSHFGTGAGSSVTAARLGNLTFSATNNILTINNTLTLTPVAGDASAQAGGTAGSIRYSADAGGAGVGGFLFYNGSSWQRLNGLGTPIVRSTSCQGTGCVEWTTARGGYYNGYFDTKKYLEVSCQAGEIMTGGGCKIGDHDANEIGSWPVDNNTWGCGSGGYSAGKIYAYAICTK